MNQNVDSTNWMEIRIRHRQPPAELQTHINYVDMFGPKS